MYFPNATHYYLETKYRLYVSILSKFHCVDDVQFVESYYPN